MVKIRWVGEDLSRILVFSTSSDGYQYIVDKSHERFRVLAKFRNILVWAIEFQNVSGDATLSVNLRVMGILGNYVGARVNFGSGFNAVFDCNSARQFINLFDDVMRAFLKSYAKFYDKFVRSVKNVHMYNEYFYLSIISSAKFYMKYNFDIYPGVGAGVEMVYDGYPSVSYVLRADSFEELEDILEALMVSESGSKFSSLAGGGNEG